MSKPVKSLITNSYQSRFADLESAVLIDIRGVGANDNTRLRHELASKQIRVTVVKNSLARTAFKDTALEQLTELLEGPNAMVYGGQSVVEVARELIDIIKTIKAIEFKGAIMEGQLFGPSELEALSKYPTRDEAIAQVVQIVLSPAQNIVGAALGPGRKVAALVKAVEEKLEKGETVSA